MLDSSGFLCSFLIEPTSIHALRGSSASEPLCDWRGPSLLRLRLSAATEIKLGDFIRVRPSLIHPAQVEGETLGSCAGPNEQDMCCCSTILPLDSPALPAVPVAQVDRYLWLDGYIYIHRLMPLNLLIFIQYICSAGIHTRL